jgi:hypothetical protein
VYLRTSTNIFQEKQTARPIAKIDPAKETQVSPRGQA